MFIYHIIMKKENRGLVYGMTPLVQRVDVRILDFHHLCTGKTKFEVPERGMHNQEMCLGRFFFVENFHYLSEGALDVPMISRKFKYTPLK